ncbi:hypothetical protein BZL30_3475 [Mycobacterium kansasii]|uniref:Uncharacterized protein n=1 Tax=Mycobacterium kansasii TaxID=1768 RepID=A0A1V3XD86_MYCKA|nr:hypothetical protein BZL30_3475 [Mycobacterium kansasii]
MVTGSRFPPYRGTGTGTGRGTTRIRTGSGTGQNGFIATRTTLSRRLTQPAASNQFIDTLIYSRVP